MKILVFLGNPGKKYALNRHNVGFMIGEFIANDLNISLKSKKFSSIIGTGKYNGEDIVLVFPQTYMNNSGEAVQAVTSFYKEKLDNIIVVHDELELPFADYRHKKDGGHKGNNGIRSIIQHMGSADFHRFRFGVGRPSNANIPVADYLLSNFSKDEISKIEELFSDVKDEIFNIIMK